MKKFYIIPLFITFFSPFISFASDKKDIGEKKGLAEKAKPKIPEHIKVAIAKNKEDEISKFINEQGTFIEAIDENSNTLLHLAVMNNAVNSVRTLLYAGINETILNNNGLAALHIAIEKNLPKIVSLLIEYGADVQIKDKKGMSAFEYKTSSAVTKLLQQAQKTQADFVSSLVQMGIKLGAQIMNFPDFIKKGNVSDFRRCINLIPNAINAQDEQGNSLLHYAIVHENPNIVRLLLARGANLEAVDIIWKRTPLLFALARELPTHIQAQYGTFDPTIINLLLDFGANVNAQDKTKKTALHYAVQKNLIEIVKRLIQLGADVDIKDKSGKSPIDYATTDEMRQLFKNIAIRSFKEAQRALKPMLHPGIETILHQHIVESVSAIDAIKKAIREGNKQALEKLIGTVEKPLLANINQADETGYTPLHMAVLENRPEMVSMLLDRGANLQAQTSDGYTPLHIAVLQHNPEIVKLLLDYGANREAQAHFKKQTPRDLAVEAKFADIVKILDEYKPGEKKKEGEKIKGLDL
jgi:ankyrin repeat protein